MGDWLRWAKDTYNHYSISCISKGESHLSIYNIIPIILLALISVIAYWNSLHVPFILDDWGSIYDNETIRRLWPPTIVFPTAMMNATVGGRPLLNFSFALNFAVNGLNTWGYHAVNLTIHFMVATVIFCLVRDCLKKNGTESNYSKHAVLVALCAAAIWAVHPLNTQAVTYIVQRGESLASLFYLLVLFFLLKSSDSEGSAFWLALSASACLLGVATKEIVATAPLAALLFDRSFVAGSYRGAIRQRWLYHAVLWSTLGFQAFLLLSTGFHGQTTGLVSGVSPQEYLSAEIWVIIDYLKLVFYPSPLIFHYGGEFHSGFFNLLPRGIILATLLVGTGYSLYRWPKIGFVASMFFIVLSPTSSFFPIIDTAFEHRMYLPGACVVVITSVLIYEILIRITNYNLIITVIVLVVVAVASLAYATISRNKVYQSEFDLWSDIVAKSPRNGRAYEQIGKILLFNGDPVRAVQYYEKAAALWPDDAATLKWLSIAYHDIGNYNKSNGTLDRLMNLYPRDHSFKLMKASLLLEEGRLEESLVYFVEVDKNLNGDWAVLFNIGNILVKLGRSAEAVPRLKKAVAIRPDIVDLRNTLGAALMATGDLSGAAVEFKEALKMDGNNEIAKENLSKALLSH